jgi:hypothetical protein
MACTVVIEQKDVCDVISSSVDSRVYRCDYDLYHTAVQAGEIVVDPTNPALITSFVPTAKILYLVSQGENMNVAPTATSKMTADGINRFTQSVLLYIANNDSTTVEQLSKLGNKRQVIIYENTQSSGDGIFKVFGHESGLVIADGGLVRN